MDMSTKREWTVRTSQDLGRALAGVRRARGLTQEEMAREAGLHRPYLSRLESGLAPIVVKRVLAVLRRAGASVTITIEDRDGRP